MLANYLPAKTKYEWISNIKGIMKQTILKCWSYLKTTDLVPFVVLITVVGYAVQQHNSLQERVHKIENVINEGIYIPEQPTLLETEELCGI